MDNKEILKGKFACGSTPSEDDFKALIDSCVGNLTDVLQLPAASSSLVNTSYKIGDKIYTCKLQGGTYQWVAIDLGGGGATSYLTLSDKPAINGVTLGGDKSPADLGLLDANGYAIVTPENTDRIFILRGGVAQMIQVQDIAGQGGGMVKFNVDDYNNPYTFNIPAGATRASFRFNVESGTIIEKEVELANGDYSVVGHAASASDLYVVDFGLTISDYQCEISITYGSYNNTDGYLANKDGVLESITFK